MFFEYDSMLSKKALLLLLDYRHLDLLLLLLLFAFGCLDFALGVIYSKTLLPKPFDLAFVLQLAHAPFLGVHLLEAFILGELSHQFLLKFVLQAFLFCRPLGLQPELEFFSRLELLTDLTLAFGLSGLLCKCGLLFLLHIKFVTELLLEISFGAPGLFFLCKLLEECFAHGLSLCFHVLDLLLPVLLLGGIPTDHLVLVLLELLLTC